MKKGLCILLSLLLIAAGTIGAFAAQTGTVSVGGKGGKTITLDMNGSIRAELFLSYSAVTKDAPVSEIIAAASNNGLGTLTAAVNGGFFNSYYKTNVPLSFPDNCAKIYATLVKNGSVINGGGSPVTMIGFTQDGKVLIDKVNASTAVKINDQLIYCWGVNNVFHDSTAVLFFNEYLGYPVTVDPSCKVVTLSQGRVESVSAGGIITVPAGKFVMVYGSSAWANIAQWGLEPKTGDAAEFVTTMTPSRPDMAAQWNQVKTAVGAGSWLVCGGKDATDNNPEITDPKQGKNFSAQRTYAAILSDGKLQFGTVTSSPAQIASYLISIGARDAMLLDGGASSMLWEKNSGFVTNAGRKLSNVITFYEVPEKPAPAPQPAAPAGRFSDVKTTDYFFDPVEWAVENKITDGTTPTTFSPARDCTRAHVLTFLWRAAGEPHTDGLVDMLYYNDMKPDQYYSIPISWACSRGIAEGIEPHTFGVDLPISRAEFVTYLWKMAGKPDPMSMANSFTDVPKGSADEKAILWAKEQGITDGTSATTFSPDRICTRAHVITFLYRYFAK